LCVDTIVPDVAVTLTARMGKGFNSGCNEGHTPVVVVPIDLRQTARGEKDTNNRHNSSGGSPSTGIANDGDPAFTVSERGQAVALAWQPRIARNGRGQLEPVCPALNGASSGATSDSRPALLITDQRGHNGHGIAPTLHAKATNNDFAPMLLRGTAVRRLTPRECERLQGFPDDYTQIPYRGKPAADGPRYKALGNSMAVNVMRWIGERLRRFP
jgi:DNA (cytosine-5)-methyltransferase 1